MTDDPYLKQIAFCRGQRYKIYMSPSIHRKGRGHQQSNTLFRNDIRERL